MAIPLLGPLPTDIEGDIVYPNKDACFACTPPYNQRSRRWIQAGNFGPLCTQRTLVLCFDGTCDSFDRDVRQPFGTPLPDPDCTRYLSRVFTEFERRPILVGVKERRSCEAACLLSGYFHQPTYQIPAPHSFLQAGIGTYTGDNVLGTPVIQSASKLLDQMFAWNLPGHIKGIPSFLDSHPSRLTYHSRGISLFNAKLSVHPTHTSPRRSRASFDQIMWGTISVFSVSPVVPTRRSPSLACLRKLDSSLNVTLNSCHLRMPCTRGKTKRASI